MSAIYWLYFGSLSYFLFNFGFLIGRGLNLLDKLVFLIAHLNKSLVFLKLTPNISTCFECADMRGFFFLDCSQHFSTYYVLKHPSLKLLCLRKYPRKAVTLSWTVNNLPFTLNVQVHCIYCVEILLCHYRKGQRILNVFL